MEQQGSGPYEGSRIIQRGVVSEIGVIYKYIYIFFYRYIFIDTPYYTGKSLFIYKSINIYFYRYIKLAAQK